MRGAFNSARLAGSEGMFARQTNACDQLVAETSAEIPAWCVARPEAGDPRWEVAFVPRSSRPRIVANRLPRRARLGVTSAASSTRGFFRATKFRESLPLVGSSGPRFRCKVRGRRIDVAEILVPRCSASAHHPRIRNDVESNADDSLRRQRVLRAG